jgi:phosphate transport system substrate-binding protein
MFSRYPCARRAAYGSTALALALVISSQAGAETVTLRSLDGQFVLNGKIVEVMEDTYLLQGPLGKLRVSSDRVVCEGAACPAPEELIAMAVAPGVDLPKPEPTKAATPAVLDPVATTDVAKKIPTNSLAAELLKHFAASQDLDTVVEPAVDGSVSLASDAGDLVIATDPALVAAKAASLALVAGPLPQQADLAGLRTDIVAHDAVIVLTHPSNPVKELTLEQLRDIYAGSIRSWADLGGPDLPIRLVPMAKDDGHRNALEAALFTDEAAIRISGGPLVVDPAAVVATDPLAIAFVPQANQSGGKPIDIVDACGLKSSPDPFALKSGTYPLMVPVSLVSQSEPSDPMVMTLLDHARSNDADGAYAAMGMIEPGIITTSLDQLDYTLAATTSTRREAKLAEEKLADVVRHDRLSATLYFPFASTELDPSSTTALTRLADHVSSLPSGTRILVVGFSDDVGRSKRNHDVSTERARKVAAGLQDIAASRSSGIEIAFKGFGDISPVACNDTEAGRSLNRRVEIWIERPSTGGPTPDKSASLLQ